LKIIKNKNLKLKKKKEQGWFENHHSRVIELPLELSGGGSATLIRCQATPKNSKGGY
jgi:hypothetical protein